MSTETIMVEVNPPADDRATWRLRVIGLPVGCSRCRRRVAGRAWLVDEGGRSVHHAVCQRWPDGGQPEPEPGSCWTDLAPESAPAMIGQPRPGVARRAA